MEPSTAPAEQASTTPSSAALKEKKFRCKHCGREFARLEHLQRHERIHTGHKPFACAECNHAFTRSDLLTRHEKIKHNKHEDSQKSPNNTTSNGTSDYYGLGDQQPPRKRSRTCSDVGGLVPDLPSMMSPPAPLPITTSTLPPLQSQPLAAVPPTLPGQGEELSLAALSMAAEYRSMRAAPPAPHNDRRHIPLPGPSQMLLDNLGRNTEQPVDSPPTAQVQPAPFPGEGPSDSLASFLEHDTLSSYHFSTVFNTEQPMPLFSPEALQGSHNTFGLSSETVGPSRTSAGHSQGDDLQPFSWFGSRLPSLQLESSLESNADMHRSIAEISASDCLKIQDKLKDFIEVLPPDYKLPSRLAFCRYIAAYISGFHQHMPFLHIPSMSIDTCSVELVLAMAAVGAQYTFEGERGVELFRISQAVATYKIRRRDARVVARHRRSESDAFTASDRGASPPIRSSPRKSFSLGIPVDVDQAIATEDLMQTAQALLLLMALCTWAKHKEILREALAIQSLLATLIRDDGLQLPPLAPDSDIQWQDWLRRETTKRTKFIVYGFSNLHCIVYNIPPFILTSEVQLPLPCPTSEFKAATQQEWHEARKRNPNRRETMFQDALQTLFSKHGRDVTAQNSSAGNYALIHALIQQIFFVRQVSRGRFSPSGSPGDISADDISALENALWNWQAGWKLNPESSLDPFSPKGPVAFNSTALLRLAYIRLYVDTASRSLDSRDPALIAQALRDGPAIKRSPKITRAVLHSVHALSIPIKIGYRLVARTQSFIWSIQHSLCTLECAYLLSKWLEALSVETPDPPVTEDERRIVEIVKSLLDETEFALPEESRGALDAGSTVSVRGANGSSGSPMRAASADSTNLSTAPAGAELCQPASLKRISAGVLRVWATIFRGSQTWAIVEVIGSALTMYADVVEAG